MPKPQELTHLEGEEAKPLNRTNNAQSELETFDRKVFVEWDPHAAVTPMAQLPFFIEFLKVGRRFETWVDECPLRYTSNNAPEKIDVLGLGRQKVLNSLTQYLALSTHPQHKTLVNIR